MTPRSAARRQATPEPSLPEVLIPPSQAKPSEREAYWIDLLQEGNVENLKAAIQTTDFFSLVQEFPASLWGSRLSIYLYRLEDDNGMMIKNSEKPNYVAVFYAPIAEEMISRDKRCGGGKYQAWLKLDNKETLVKHTFRIDGPPKLHSGQYVEIEGKAVPVGAAAAPAAPEPRTDLAGVIAASADANKQTMEIMAEGSKAAIQLVRDQASAATKSESTSPLLEKILTVLVERALTPPAVQDPLTTLKAAKELFASTATEPPEREDPPLEKAMDLLEKATGRSFSELVRGKSNPAQVDQYGWIAPLANVAQQLIAQFPTIMEQARIARDLEFRRQIWLRTQPGTGTGTVPQDLLPASTSAPAAPQPAAVRGRQPAQPFTPPANVPPQPEAQPAAPDPMQLVGAIVNEICAWFDRRHVQGYQCAAMIDGLHGEHIEALGLQELLVNEEQVKQLIAGNPLLAARSSDARWADFEHDFIAYMQDRWGDDEDADEPEPPRPINGQSAGPQPAA